MHIGKRISKLRNAIQMTQEQLCEGIISRSHLSNIESGRYEPFKDILILFSNRLNVPQGYLTDFSIIDHTLLSLLNHIKEVIDDGNIEQSQMLINRLHQEYYPYISSIYLELYSFLLDSYYAIKSKDYPKGLAIFEERIKPLLNDDEIDSSNAELKEMYFYIQGIFYYFHRDYINSLSFYFKQLSILKNNNARADTLYNVSLSFFKLYDYTNAISYGEKALRIYEDAQKWIQIAETFNTLGAIYLEDKQYSKAEEIFLKSLEISQKLQLEYLEGKIYHNLGISAKGKDNYFESLSFFNKSLRIKKKINSDSVCLTYRSILNNYLSLELFNEIKPILEEAKDICIDEGELVFIEIIEAKVGLQNGQKQLYESVMNNALRYFHSNKLWKHLINYAEEFADYYYNTKQYKKSTKYLKIIIEANKLLHRRKE